VKTTLKKSPEERAAMLARIRENIERGDALAASRKWGPGTPYHEAMKRKREARWARAFPEPKPEEMPGKPDPYELEKLRAERKEEKARQRAEGVKRAQEHRQAVRESRRLRSFAALSPAKLREAATTLRLIETGSLEGYPTSGLTSAYLLQLAEEKERRKTD
jgi:hypothetical protein